jgi:hypothetical protein
LIADCVLFDGDQIAGHALTKARWAVRSGKETVGGNMEDRCRVVSPRTKTLKDRGPATSMADRRFGLSLRFGFSRW